MKRYSTKPLLFYIATQASERRKKLGYTQAETASFLGISTHTYGFFERGKQFLHISRIWMLARLFDVEVGYFFPTRLWVDQNEKIVSIDDVKI